MRTDLLRPLGGVAKSGDKAFLKFRVIPPKFEIALSCSKPHGQSKTFFGFFAGCSHSPMPACPETAAHVFAERVGTFAASCANALNRSSVEALDR